MTESTLNGQTAVVTGAESGIGRETAIVLAEQGISVFGGDLRLSDENTERFRQLSIRRRKCDVRRESNLRDLIDAAVSETGRIDILVNNAGVGMVKPVVDVSEADWDFCIDTNLKGPFFACKYAIAQMVPQRSGVIVNVASNAGILPRAHDPVYSISKLAVVGLTKSLALCHAKDRIRINAVCPGPVGETGMMNDDIAQADDPAEFVRNVIAASSGAEAWGRMISPREIAEAILYLCSPAAVMVTGTILAIDGGKSLGVAPRIES